MRTLFCFLVLGCLFLWGCHKEPSNILPKDTYINLLIELQLLKSYQFAQYPDSLTVDSLRNAIFKKYGTTKKQFKKSHTFYKSNVDAQNKRIQEAIKRLNKDRMDKVDSLSTSDSTQKGLSTHPS